jgi:membrane protein
MPIVSAPQMPRRPSELARPSERPAVAKTAPRLSVDVFRVAYDRLARHAGNSLSGGLAFGALLSIAPLAIVVIAIASTFLGEGAAREETLTFVGDALGQQVVPVVARWIDEARQWSAGATVLGVVLFFYGAARLVGLVDECFEIVFQVPPRREETTRQAIKRWLSSQAMAVGITLLAGVLMAGSLVARTVGASLMGTPDDLVLAVLAAALRESVSLTVWVLALAVIYKVLPPVHLHTRDILRGAVVSALLLEVALLVLRALATTLELGAAYGAAGAVVATLLTLYVVAQLFLFGAEVTAELSERRDGPSSERLTPARAACTDAPDPVVE